MQHEPRPEVSVSLQSRLVISNPKNNSSCNLSELRLFDVWILPRTKYHMSPLPIMYLVCCLSAVYTSSISHKESQTHLRQHTYRAGCTRSLIARACKVFRFARKLGTAPADLASRPRAPQRVGLGLRLGLGLGLGSGLGSCWSGQRNRRLVRTWT